MWHIYFLLLCAVRPRCITLVFVAHTFRLSSPRRSISRPGPFGAEPLLDAARTHSLQRGAAGRNAFPASAVVLAAPGPLCRGAANAGAASERGTPRTAPSTLFAHDAATILGPRGDWLAFAKLTGGEASELGPGGFRCYRSWPQHITNSFRLFVQSNMLCCKQRLLRMHTHMQHIHSGQSLLRRPAPPPLRRRRWHNSRRRPRPPKRSLAALPTRH